MKLLAALLIIAITLVVMQIAATSSLLGVFGTAYQSHVPDAPWPGGFPHIHPVPQLMGPPGSTFR